MGLLDKATQIHSTASIELPPAKRSGLLERAAKASEASPSGRTTESPEGLPGASLEKTRAPGLFERARKLREKAQKGSLFHRASAMREEHEQKASLFSSVEPESYADSELNDEFTDDDSYRPSDSDQIELASLDVTPDERDFDPGPEVLPEISASEAETLLFDQEEEDDSITLTVDELADLHGPLSEDSESETMPDEASADDGFPDLPDYSIEDRSPDTEDPALSEGSDLGDADPFDQWQDEAARDAESRSRELTGEKDRGRQLYEDEEIMTAPVETHIGSQKRIDNYLALFELNRELHSINETEEFWDTALYSILGQLGSRTVIIFAGVHGDRDAILYPVAHSGITPVDDWNLKAGDELFDALSKSDEIRYAGEFLKDFSGISEMERGILESSRTSLLMPLSGEGALRGIIFVGPPMDRADYIIDDLEYLRLLGGSLIGPFDRIQNIQKHRQETEELAKQNAMHRSHADLTASLQTKKTVDEIYDLLLEHFKRTLGVDSLSLVLLDPAEQSYKIFAGNRISPESLKRFNLPVSGSDLVGTISNLSGVYNLVDFRSHPEIGKAYSGDDLALMQYYWILPLINLNWLVGFITVHRTDRPWTEEEREAGLIACAHLAPVLANCLILQERETLFRDPFSPLEKRLEREVQKALEFHSFLSIVDFRVRNLKKILGANSMITMTEFYQSLSRTLSRSLHQTDYMSRMGPGRYVLLLPGRGRTEAGIFADRLQMELRQANLLRSSAVAPTYSFDVINFPDDGDSLQKLIALLDR